MRTPRTMLYTLFLSLGSVEEKRVEDLTETGEMILIQVLLAEVKRDDYYPVKSLQDRLAEHFENDVKWINAKWVGNALRRLGFKEKRRFGTGYQYRLTPEAVQDLAKRMAVDLPQPQSKDEEERGGALCPYCQRPVQPGPGTVEDVARGRRWHTDCYNRSRGTP